MVKKVGDHRTELIESDGTEIDLPTLLEAIVAAAEGGETATEALATLIGEVQASPTANTLLERLKALESAIGPTSADTVAVGAVGTVTGKLRKLTTDLDALITAVGALGYEFTINGVNFNGYENIKMLDLPSNAKDDVPVTLHDAGENYQVPADHIFIAFQACIHLEQTAMIGRIGESDTADGAISKEVLKLSHGVLVPFMESCIGVFAATKWVTAETDSTNASYEMVSRSAIYGVEVDIS